MSDKCPPTLRFHQRQPLVNTYFSSYFLCRDTISFEHTNGAGGFFISYILGNLSSFLNALDLFLPKPEPHLQTLLQILVPPNLIIFYSLRSSTSVVATATRTSLSLSGRPLSLDALLRQTSKHLEARGTSASFSARKSIGGRFLSSGLSQQLAPEPGEQ